MKQLKEHEEIQAWSEILKNAPIHDPIFKAAFLKEIRQRIGENFAELLECTIDSMTEQKAGSPTL